MPVNPSPARAGRDSALVRAGATACGLLLGMGLDAVFADPRRHHPVAGFGRAAGALERAMHRDDRATGVAYTAVCVGVPLAGAVAAERAVRGRPWARAALTAAVTWTVLGGASLAREGHRMAWHLERADDPTVPPARREAALGQARHGLRSLCARDPGGLGPKALARATVESLAENSSDAVVAPLVWGAVAGVPGLVAYRAANTLDAMVGYRSERYRNFGWASARLDDLLNVVPARLCGALTALLAPLVGGSTATAWRVMRRDARHHPSPNGGWPEAAAAGALGVRLGGSNTYHGQVEVRPDLGEGPGPTVPDVRRAVRLTRAAGWAGAVVAAGAALALALPRRGRTGG